MLPPKLKVKPMLVNALAPSSLLAPTNAVGAVNVARVELGPVVPVAKAYVFGACALACPLKRAKVLLSSAALPHHRVRRPGPCVEFRLFMLGLC